MELIAACCQLHEQQKLFKWSHTTHSYDGPVHVCKTSDRYQMRRAKIKKTLYYGINVLCICDLLRRLKELKNRSQLIDKTGSLSTHHGNSLLTDFHLTLHVSIRSQMILNRRTTSWTMTTADDEYEWDKYMHGRKQTEKHDNNNNCHNTQHCRNDHTHISQHSHTVANWLGLFNTHRCVFAVFFPSHLFEFSFFSPLPFRTPVRARYQYRIENSAEIKQLTRDPYRFNCLTRNSNGSESGTAIFSWQKGFNDRKCLLAGRH